MMDKCVIALMLIAIYNIPSCHAGLNISKIERVTNSLPYLYCLKPDLYREDTYIACTVGALFFFDINTLNFTLISGSSGGIRGYADGYLKEAKFRDLYDVIQVKKNSFIVTDGSNYCLRWINDSHASHLAGQCLSAGDDDANFTHARFSNPAGMLYFKDYLYVTDFLHSEIRMVDFRTRLVKTAIIDLLLANPAYMAIRDASTPHTLYVSTDTSITKVDLTTNETKIVAGAGPNINGDWIGPLAYTRFRNVRGITFISESIMLVADKDNNRILLLDLNNNVSSTFMDEVYMPWFVFCRISTLYIGTWGEGLWKASMMDDSESCTCSDIGPSMTLTNGASSHAPIIKSTTALQNVTVSLVDQSTIKAAITTQTTTSQKTVNSTLTNLTGDSTRIQGSSIMSLLFDTTVALKATNTSNSHTNPTIATRSTVNSSTTQSTFPPLTKQTTTSFTITSTSTSTAPTTIKEYTLTSTLPALFSSTLSSGQWTQDRSSVIAVAVVGAICIIAALIAASVCALKRGAIFKPSYHRMESSPKQVTFLSTRSPNVPAQTNL